MTALLLLLPQTPMLFQGQEFAASAPFLYFADHRRRAGRRWCARARASSSRSSRASRRRGRAARSHDPARPVDVRALQARSGRSGERIAERAGAAPRPAAAAPRRSRCFARSARAASTARCSPTTRSCCASSAAHGDDRLLVVNLGARPARRSRRRAAARAAARDGVAWRTVFSSEVAGVRRLGHAAARDDRRRLADSRRMRAVLLDPSR